MEDVQGVIGDAIKGDAVEYKNRIEDARNVTSVELGYKEFQEFAKTIRAAKRPHAVKMAILTKSSLQFGIARMFQMLVDDSSLKVEIFTDEIVVRKWLLSNE